MAIPPCGYDIVGFPLEEEPSAEAVARMVISDSHAVLGVNREDEDQTLDCTSHRTGIIAGRCHKCGQPMP